MINAGGSVGVLDGLEGEIAAAEGGHDLVEDRDVRAHRAVRVARGTGAVLAYDDEVDGRPNHGAIGGAGASGVSDEAAQRHRDPLGGGKVLRSARLHPREVAVELQQKDFGFGSGAATGGLSVVHWSAPQGLAG